MLSRRKFIQALTVAATLPINTLKAKGLLSRNTFKFPPLELGTRSGKDVYFDLNLQSGFSRILNNLKTKTWGINQDFLGTTLRANKGDRVHISVNNKLDETATLHWHGMKLPSKADGGPHQPIRPNKTWLSEFDIIQPAATTWYHSHQMHKTGEQVYKGLAGLFIIDDEESSSLNLPSEYGVDDFPVIIQDREFNRDGSFSYGNSMHDKIMGKMGSVVLVNGVISPVLSVQKSVIRFRVLNGSNARVYNLSFDDNRHFHLIGSDGGLLEKPLKTSSFTLAPAERVEILLDVSDGKMPILRHVPEKNPKSGRGMVNGGGMMGMMSGDSQEFDIFQIDARKVKNMPFNIPQKLVQHRVNKRASKTRHFDLQMKMGPMMMFGNAFSINGKSMDIDIINEVVKAGSTEIWVVENSSMMAHPFHIHNVQFKIIEKNNASKHETGFKDVVLVQPGTTVKLLISFPEYSDKNTPYMYHCHILEHEDQGMMGQFTVV